jgi:hypothetical protein
VALQWLVLAREGVSIAMASDALYQIVALSAETAEPLPVFWALTPSSGRAPAAHVCSKNSMAYHLRVVNNSSERIAVKITVDGQSALPPGACFIVRANKQRDLPGFQQKREFDGDGNFRHTYADFVFGRPNLDEPGAPAQRLAAAAAEESERVIGVIKMDVYRAVQMNCPAQSIEGSVAQRQAVSAEKKEAVFTSLTVAGRARAQPARKITAWFKEGGDILETVKLHYKEVHALVHYGVDRTLLGLPPEAQIAQPSNHARSRGAGAAAPTTADFIEECDLTMDSDDEGAAAETSGSRAKRSSSGAGPVWTKRARPKADTVSLDDA